MGYDINWGDTAHTWVLLTLYDHTVGTELIEAVDRVLVHMDEVEHTVSVVADFTAATRAPAGTLGVFPEISKRFGHPNSSRYLVLVGVTRRTFSEIFSRVLRRVDYATTLEEAAELVAKRHSELENEDH